MITLAGLVMFGVGFVLVVVAWKLLQFIKADCDLNLLNKAQPRSQAFARRVIWIVGASQGLGEQLAYQLSAQGALLVLSSRSKERLERVKAGLTGTYAQHALVWPLDVTAPSDQLEATAKQVERAVREQQPFVQGVSALIYNAGASQHAAAQDTHFQVADALLDLNLRAGMHMIRAILPYMLERRSGQVVVLSSMAAVTPSPGQSCYSACKAGLNAYCQALSYELRPRGIDVTICCPGPIATDTPDRPRGVYGPTGMLQQQVKAEGKGMRQSPKRVAELVLRAMHHRVLLCWIVQHPILLLGYIAQSCPALARAYLHRIGPGRVAAMAKGGDGYAGMLGAGLRQPKSSCSN